MVNVHIDPTFDDAERRRRIYAGDIIVYSSLPEIDAFVAFTRALVTDALGADPVTVHKRRDTAALADLLIEFKPRFIHHPDSIQHVGRIVEALGGAARELHADVPKLRTAFPTGGLSTGIAYAFQPHRDTWYAAPPQQINWWLPIWPLATDNAMEFFPCRFDASVENDSADYNYYTANAWRGRIQDFSGGRDTRVHPAPRIPLPPDEARLCLVPPVGGVMVFSGDHLHATIRNTSPLTRYSVDFRTVHAVDVLTGEGAPVRDVACRGTALRDFRRLSDGAMLPEPVIAKYDTEGAAEEGVTVFVG